MTTWKLEHNDVIEWAKGYTGEKFHSLLTDSPYHLTTPQRFGLPNSKPPKGDVYRRASAGMMGQQWDGLGESGKGIAFDPETWAALTQHLYSGGFGMAFSGSRGWHRMAVAIEDAGMIIHPSIFGWAYLSGFPKATRIKGYGSPEFTGHRYGLQALKPALEPIIVFQKPYEGRPVDSIVATGAGALNIDGGRIAASQDDPNVRTKSSRLINGKQTDRVYGKFAPLDGAGQGSQFAEIGRWPSNFLLQHHPEDNGDCHPDCPVRLFDEQAGESVSRSSDTPQPIMTSKGIAGGAYGNAERLRPDGHEVNRDYTRGGYDDSGPASRMFHRSDWQYEVAEQLANAEPVRYEPKVSSSEREAGLEGFEEGETQKYRSIRKDRGSGYDEASKARNNHPTLKPISLTRYLATLLLPPAAYAPRRILVPFSGVSSEMIGCVLAGWESVTGIESNAAYAEIARARLAWWSQWPGWGQTDVDAILAAAKVDDVGQLSLFDESA